MAEKWGADVVRDSDGTKLSPEILEAGLGVYSTVCLIREDNAWAKAHQDTLQQNFLMSEPVTAFGAEVVIDPLATYSLDQFRLNTDDGVEFWQVFDRTTGTEAPRDQWRLEGGRVVVADTVAGHRYTVNFLAYRLWEEISMYNHVTNDWGDRERLMSIDPRHPAAAEHLAEWLEAWCVANPSTTVVRFTSLFYNFAWFWGSEPERPHHYADWGSYDFTVSPLALRQFREETGQAIASEDFVNAGRYTSTHNPPSAIYESWMAFVGRFVRELGARLVDIVHRHGKAAYVFYDDSWVGVEPYSGSFEEIGFDGIIKSVFSAYEARLCAGVPTGTHELRLHPYLFPVDLEGKPTFEPGCRPEDDLQLYWTRVRRGMLRARIDRIGLGGYLSLTEPFPVFQDAVADMAAQHRTIRDLHLAGAPAVEPVLVGVLTSWGTLRSWTASGHLHENPDLVLNHALESLAGQPYRVEFLRLDDVAANGVPAEIDVLLNAGPAGSAWSGGDAWRDPALQAAVRAFVADGGGLVGIQDPTAAHHGLGVFQLADVLGVDRDPGDLARVMKRTFAVANDAALLADGAAAPAPRGGGLFLTRPGVEVAATDDDSPLATVARFGEGTAVYLASLDSNSPAQRRLLSNAVQTAAGTAPTLPRALDPRIDVTLFPTSNTLAVANASSVEVTTTLLGGPAPAELVLAPGELRLLAAE
jgi:beta-D-galactosyl-(1->4)-L-rhamnose phosphorylase